MADGLFNLCGERTNTLTKDGKTYTLTVRRLADYAKKEAAILLRMASPYQGINAIPSENRIAAVKAIAEVVARPLIATLEDEERFDQSMRGIAYSVWRCLCERHVDEFPPDADVEVGIQLGMNFIEWYGVEKIGHIIKAINTAEEKPILKNSDGQTAEAA